MNMQGMMQTQELYHRAIEDLAFEVSNSADIDICDEVVDLIKKNWRNKLDKAMGKTQTHQVDSQVHLMQQRFMPSQYPYLQWHKKLLNIINNNSSSNQQSIIENNINALNQYNQQTPLNQYSIDNVQQNILNPSMFKNKNSQQYFNNNHKNNHNNQLDIVIKPIDQEYQGQKNCEVINNNNNDYNQNDSLKNNNQFRKSGSEIIQNDSQIQEANDNLTNNQQSFGKNQDNKQENNLDDQDNFKEEFLENIQNDAKNEENIEEDEDAMFFQDEMVVQKNSREKQQSNNQNIQKKIKIEFKTDNVDTNKNFKNLMKSEDQEDMRLKNEMGNEKNQMNINKMNQSNGNKQQIQKNNFQSQQQEQQQANQQQQNEEQNDSDGISLGSKDDIPDQEQLDTKNVIYGYYTKVNRSGTKWKVFLKNLIAKIEDKEFIFQDLQGEFQFINEN